MIENASLLRSAADQIDALDAQIADLNTAKKDVFGNLRETISPVAFKAWREAVKLRRANMDGDNLQKGIFDLLQQIGAIDNDKNVMGCNWFWIGTLPEGTAAEISIVQADAVGMAA